MDDHPGGLAPLFDDVGKDRTYTDQELQELLSFVENMDNATSADELAGGLNHVGLGLAPANAGLSHPVPHAPVLPMRFNEQGISLQFQPGPMPWRGRGRGGRGGGRGGAPAVGNLEAPMSASPAIEDDGSQRVSHGASEKQRRDRINAMIDELRTLVPGQAGGGEGRRSKYIVLQDTINMITVLKARCQAQERELVALRAAGASSGASDGVQPQDQQQHQQMMTLIGQDGQGLVREDSIRNPANGTDSTLNSGQTINVAVEMGEEICYVKIKAPDRQGLLQDILNALHALPMTVQRAVVTTDSENGVVFVTDIFELKINTAIPVEQGMSTEDVKTHIHRSLHASFLAYENPELYARKRRGTQGGASGTDSGGSWSGRAAA
uniref:BHLH domain-containing protein n=1 Tax=Micromonas pusilla TaxID=38833 RepID=A0A7S0IGZ0_MICPS|mmetsp:Transcript_6529/g.27155  ORF Transcript_6529/g.27155 Transcript_6529/m.27155 type:complete len:380 (+) Transcript_6529:230-1369(+)